MKKIHKVYAVVVILSGCERNIDTNFYADDLSAAKGKALVVMRSYSLTPGDSQIQIMQSKWRKNYEDIFFKTAYKELAVLRKDYEDMQSYSLEPGKYSLQSLDMLGGGFFGLAFGSKNYHANNLNNIASFTVKSGDVIYLGDLFLNAKTSSNIARSIRIEDHYDGAENYIKKFYPHLQSKLEKRLIKLSTPVSLIQDLDRNSIDAAIKGMK